LFGHGGHIKDGRCSINGISPGLEDSQSGASLKRMLSGDHTIHAHHDSAPRPNFPPLLFLRDHSASREEQGTSKEKEIPLVRCHKLSISLGAILGQRRDGVRVSPDELYLRQRLDLSSKSSAPSAPRRHSDLGCAEGVAKDFTNPLAKVFRKSGAVPGSPAP